MKKILIPTDFSVPAENAARYAVKLAKVLKADVLICNAFKVPAETPMAAQVAWPLMDYATLKEEVSGDLDVMVKKLEDPSCDAKGTEYCPQIHYESDAGTVCEVVSSLVKSRKIDLVVMGMSGAGGLTQFILGSNSKEMIEKAEFPVLLVPYAAGFKKISKIVFATNLSKEDMEPLQLLVRLAEALEAEVVVAHITSKEASEEEKLQQKIDAFIDEISAQINYPKIKYEYVWNIDVNNGLDWITEQSGVDMVAMVHHHHNLLGKVFKGSHTQKLSRHTEIPLLVFPQNEHVIYL